MIAILGIDGLEPSLVQKFGCRNLMQESWGTTDLSEYEEKRTVVIWSSFLAGRNTENEVLAGNDLWEFRLRCEDTFLSRFSSPVAIDVVGLNHDSAQHKREREALKGFFDKTVTVEEYDRIALEWHRKVKAEFFSALAAGSEKHDIVMAYFDAIDIVGHLSFGNELKMRMLYREFDEIAADARKKCAGPLLIISDHGMKKLGNRYGDHSDAGFWSVNRQKSLGSPKPREFYEIICGGLE